MEVSVQAHWVMGLTLTPPFTLIAYALPPSMSLLLLCDVPPIPWGGFYTVADVGSVRASALYPLVRILIAALTSRSSSAPQSHECQRSLSSFLWTLPQELHI